MQGFSDRVAAGKVKQPEPPRAKRVRDPAAAPTEYQEQARFCDWLLGAQVYYFAVPNGAFLAGDPQQRQIRWRQMARIGCKQGVPDLVIVKAPPLRPDIRAVCVEMKRAAGGRLSEEQRFWHALLAECGWLVIVGHGADDAIRQMQALGYGATVAA